MGGVICLQHSGGGKARRGSTVEFGSCVFLRWRPIVIGFELGRETQSAVSLMAGTFTALANDRRLSHAEALQKSMLAMINDNARVRRGVVDIQFACNQHYGGKGYRQHCGD
jgi:hypothetical protein